MTDDHELDGHEETLERLKEIARERWGEHWTITQQHFADGTTKATAWRNFGPVDVDDVEGKVFEREEIRIDGDEALHSHVYRRADEVVEQEYEITAVDEIGDLER